MKRLALTAVDMWRSYLFVNLQVVVSIALILGILESVHAAECSSGDVTCLIAKINGANAIPGEHVIILDPGIYTLQIALPVITGSIRIQASSDDPPTVIERDPGAPGFRIFTVSAGGELTLEGLTVQRGGFGFAPAILNDGKTTLQDTIITDNNGEGGAIRNTGTLNVFRSIITDNSGGHDAGGIFNQAGGIVLVENSTIAHNTAVGSGGIGNFGGSLVVKNSAIIFNRTVQCCEPGGGIGNAGGSVEIVNSTIAKNTAGGGLGFGGGGLWNGGGGQVSITSSTIRENQVSFANAFSLGGGIENEGGTVRIQNTIIAGNTIPGENTPITATADCFGTITSVGNNLVGDPSGCDINLQPSDLMGDPGLGSLVGTGEDDLPGRAYYPVLTGSPLIDKGNPNACLQTDQLGNLRVGICDIGAVEFRGPVLVSVDVRPKRDANRINPNSSKDINVAVFSVNGFDATTVNANTVRFGATGTEAAPVRVGLRDVDGDGDLDMVLGFAIPETGITCGDTSASLTGVTSQGLSIIGSSPIKTVQCGKQKGHAVE